MSLPWDTLVGMTLPADTKALLMLRELRKSLPDLPPAERLHDAACRRFKEACCLVVEGRHVEAVALMSRNPPGRIIRFPSAG